jgi:membrane-associated phospholipid phosphatase
MDSDWRAVAVSVTDFGNLAVVGPGAVLVWLWLQRRRGLRAAWRYQWPVAVTFVLTVGLKMVSRETGGAFHGTLFALSTGAPSGHMAMSTVVYGGVALMLIGRGVEPIGLLTALLTIVGLAGVAVTRVLLHTHTPADVATGFVIGGSCAVWISRVAEVPAREPARHVAELVIMLGSLMVLLNVLGFRFYSTLVL